VEDEPLRVTRPRGGNHHPLPTRLFIIDYLTAQGEATIPELHDAYKSVLREKARQNGRRNYHWARYGSFKTQVLKLVKEDIIEFSGRTEKSLSERFKYWPEKPLLRYYRLKR